jgi:hypothetical protein
MGGLAQALAHRDHDAESYGLCVVQLKRALRGAAFARGALFLLRLTMSTEQFDELFRVLEQMETDIVFNNPTDSQEFGPSAQESSRF